MPNIILFRDTETTGFKKSGALIQEGQARICQIAMILADHTGKPLMKFSSLIKPEGWQVSQFNIDSCGITQDDCENYGLPIASVIALYRKLAAMATLLVAHNDDFDNGIIEIEEAHDNAKTGQNIFVDRPRFCTMKTNSHISGNGKWPKLPVALKHYTGRDLSEADAHDAMNDTQACMDVYFAMQRRKNA